jgi:hypothetical protein
MCGDQGEGGDMDPGLGVKGLIEVALWEERRQVHLGVTMSL